MYIFFKYNVLLSKMQHLDIIQFAYVSRNERKIDQETTSLVIVVKVDFDKKLCFNKN